MRKQCEKNLEQAIKCLKSIPRIQGIIENLPKGLKCVFSEDILFGGCYYSMTNTIVLNAFFFFLDTPQNLLNLCCTLVHELCHANQKYTGLFPQDLISPSFSEAFRIARMTEIEAYLLKTIVENELLKRPEFSDCMASERCRRYQREFAWADGDVQKANTNFILSYWQNSMEDLCLYENKDEKARINSFYFHYVIQSYGHASLLNSHMLNTLASFVLRGKKRRINRRTAQETMRLYAQRMDLTGVEPEQFLSNGFDKIQIPEDYKQGIILLEYNGNENEHLLIRSSKAHLAYYKAFLFKEGVLTDEFLINNYQKIKRPKNYKAELKRQIEKRTQALQDLVGLIGLIKGLKKKVSPSLENKEPKKSFCQNSSLMIGFNIQRKR